MNLDPFFLTRITASMVVKKNIRAANAVATYLNKKSKSEGHVIMSLINPYQQFRNELKEDNKDEVVEVLLISGRQEKANYHVEGFEAGNPDFELHTDEVVGYTWNKLKDLLKV